MLRSYKEGKFLVFELEEGRDVRYDLSDGSTYGLSGKKVKNVNNQLKGYDVWDVIKSFEDEVYRKFLTRVYKSINTGVTNTGTFLTYARRYRNLEQFYTAGLEKVSTLLRYDISQVPKGLINICKNHPDIELNNALIKQYKKHTDIYNLYLNKKYKCIEHKNLVHMLDYDMYDEDSYLSILLNEYNYNPKRLIEYMDDLMYYEGLESLRGIVRELYDYARVTKKIANGHSFEKYPINFLTTIKITWRNYNRLNVKFNEDEFKARIDESLEYKCGEYRIVYPSSTDDIKQEAVNMQHCVASYIQEVIDGNCHIMFLRHENKLDESLMTVEVRDGKIVHAAGLHNRMPNAAEQYVIYKYNTRVQ